MNLIVSVYVSLLYSNHRHVSAVHVTVFRVERRRIHLELCVGISRQLKISYNFD